MYLEFLKPVEEMRPGEAYALAFMVGERPSGSGGISLSPFDSQLYLQVEGISDDWTEGGLIKPLGPGQLLVSVKLPPDVAVSSFNLRVKVTLGELGPTLAEVYNVTVRVAGAGAASPELSGRVSTVLGDIEQTLPDNYGVLYALRNGDSLTLSAHRGDAPPVNTADPLSLGHTAGLSMDIYLEGTNPFENLCGLGKSLFHELDPNILDWLWKLLRATPAPCLLIRDNTKLEIPWELIYLESAGEDDRPDGFLGALAAVARWKPVKKVGVTIEPELLGRARNGRVVSYAPRVAGFLPGVEAEIKAVEQCGASPVETINDLLTILTRKHSDVALVHIASHGTFEPDEPSVSGLETPEDVLSALGVNSRTLALLAHSRPVVFVNACHSARGSEVGWAVYGFNEAFLRQGASGLIGAMGKVRSKSAAAIAARVLKEMSAAEPAPVSEILRRIREQAASDAHTDSKPAARRFFLDAFMYVFYGSPLERVSVAG